MLQGTSDGYHNVVNMIIDFHREYLPVNNAGFLANSNVGILAINDVGFLAIKNAGFIKF